MRLSKQKTEACTTTWTSSGMTNLNQGSQHLIDGNRQSKRLGSLNQRLIERSNFGGSPGFDVLEHAAGVVFGQG